MTGRGAVPGLLVGVCLFVAGCGGSGHVAGEKAATYTVKIAKAGFPSKQAVAKPSLMELQVENTGEHAIPNFSITVDSFSYSSDYPGLAARLRPVWVIERGPGKPANPPVSTQEVSQLGAGQSAYTNTWVFGPLAAKATQTLRWYVVPVKSGAYTVHYRINSGLGGKAKTRLASGPATGQLAVEIASAPPNRYVDPKTGKLVTGTYPATAGAGAAGVP
ncbi:MAG: hypothetical protein ACYDC2_03520 [Solirubrobacteraceae bacterium]